MHRKKFWLSIGFTLMGGVVVLFFFNLQQETKDNRLGSKSSPENHLVAQNKNETPNTSSAKASDTDEPPAQRAPSGNEVETKALSAMSHLLQEYGLSEKGMDKLVEHLKETGQAPQVRTQSNPYTGDMTIVRTDNPLPGTRYFHAQYFSAEGDPKKRAQHISFEFRPSPTAMESVIQSIRQAFPGLGEPSEQKEGYAGWKLEEGYVLWVSRLKSADLKDNPFNAYTPEDAGTVRVAIEEEIHGDEEVH